MVPDELSLLVACSGGPDSTATLVAVVRIHTGPVAAAWFDHAMRPPAEVARDGGVVHGVACEIGVAVLEGRALVPPRGEAAARTARYRWLARAAAKAEAVACVTGHTRDDQAETVLLRLTRGTGARGAAGMAPESLWPVATSSVAAPRLLRPLLDVSRNEVEAYLDALGIEASHDPSNESREYARNRIRHEALPVLTDVNSKAAAHLAVFADREREDEAALSLWAGRWLEKHASRGKESVALPRVALTGLPPAVARRVLAQACATLGIVAGEAHLEALGVLAAGPGGARVSLPGALAESRGTVLRMRRNA